MEELRAVSVVDLRKQLRANHLKISGNKEELVKRLFDFNTAKEKKPATEPPKLVKKTLTPKPSKPVPVKEKKEVETPNVEPSKDKKERKRMIRLGLPLSTGLSSTDDVTSEEKIQKRAEKFNTIDNQKKKRLERFGEEAFLSAEEIVTKRRQDRFGVLPNATKEKGGKKRQRDTVQDKKEEEMADKKRQRILRFGVPSSQPLSQQAKEFRAARFGTPTSSKKEESTGTGRTATKTPQKPKSAKANHARKTKQKRNK